MNCAVGWRSVPFPRTSIPIRDFKTRFPGMPIHARRAAMKEAIGKARAYLTALATWQKSGKKQGKPGFPGATDHPTFYQGAFHLKLAEAKVHDRFVRLKVYDGTGWVWMNYPVRCSRHFQQRWQERGWKQQSPTLVLRGKQAALHFPQAKKVKAARMARAQAGPAPGHRRRRPECQESGGGHRQAG